MALWRSVVREISPSEISQGDLGITVCMGLAAHTPLLCGTYPAELNVILDIRPEYDGGIGGASTSLDALQYTDRPFFVDAASVFQWPSELDFFAYVVRDPDWDFHACSFRLMNTVPRSNMTSHGL